MHSELFVPLLRHVDCWLKEAHLHRPPRHQTFCFLQYVSDCHLCPTCSYRERAIAAAAMLGQAHQAVGQVASEAVGQTPAPEALAPAQLPAPVAVKQEAEAMQ
jgi:hypothetical protein